MVARLRVCSAVGGRLGDLFADEPPNCSRRAAFPALSPGHGGTLASWVAVRQLRGELLAGYPLFSSTPTFPSNIAAQPIDNSSARANITALR
jgi:hypothetical protein